MAQRKIAILAGNTVYPEEPALQALRCPKNDVDDLDRLLSDPQIGGFTETYSFINRRSEELLVKLNELLNQLTGEDFLLFYYSGHGKRNRRGKLHLAASNTTLDALECTSIPLENVKSLIDVSACQRIVIVLDCCYSGLAGEVFLKNSVDDEIQVLQQDSKGIYILTSSTAISVSAEKESDRNSLFTKYLLQGVETGAADVDDDGQITADDLYKYIHTEMRGNGFQIPMKWDLNVRGVLTLARSVMAPSSKVLEISERKPIAQDEALRLLQSVPKRELQQLQQLLFCYEIHKLPGNSSDASQVLDDVRIGFKEPVVIIKDDRDRMLSLAEEQYKKFDHPFKNRKDEWQNDYEHVRRVLSPVFEATPPKAECLARISYFSRATAAAFLISEYYVGRRLRGQSTVVEVLGAIGLGIEGQCVLEDTLRRWGPAQLCFQEAANIAKQALKDDFEPWYIGIRGLSFAEDLVQYQKDKKEEDEARKEQYAQELEKKLSEFVPDSTSPEPIISAATAAVLAKKADESIACLSGLDPEDEKYNIIVQSIAHKTKYLFKSYLPEVSYRIQKSELKWAKTELIAADVLAELELARDIMEMKAQSSQKRTSFRTNKWLEWFFGPVMRKKK
jgi:Caspase domain